MKHNRRPSINSIGQEKIEEKWGFGICLFLPITDGASMNNRECFLTFTTITHCKTFAKRIPIGRWISSYGYWPMTALCSLLTKQPWRPSKIFIIKHFNKFPGEFVNNNRRRRSIDWKFETYQILEKNEQVFGLKWQF